jgi:hypothetical protein
MKALGTRLDPVYCGKFGEANVLFLMAWDANEFHLRLLLDF